MGGRKGKGQQEQNAPRAKNLARAPPRAVPRVYCMRREGANAAGRREERGERRVERDRDAAPTEKRNHQNFRGCSGRDFDNLSVYYSLNLILISINVY